MDVYELNVAIDYVKKSIDCAALCSDFQGSVRNLIKGSKAYIELKDDDSNIDMLKYELADLRAELEAAQAAVSDVDDKMGDLYSKLDDIDGLIDEME